MCYTVRYRVPLSTSNWARYIDREIKLSLFYFIKAVEYLPNKLIFFNFKIYYKEENYLKVKTTVFKYIISPIVKGLVYWYVGILVYCIPVFLYSHVLSFIM